MLMGKSGKLTEHRPPKVMCTPSNNSAGTWHGNRSETTMTTDELLTL